MNPKPENKSKEWIVICPNCGTFIAIQKSDPVLCPHCLSSNIDSKNYES